uniref:Transposon MuDR mudrA n=1 Tax=Solanum tuberosum TaxID=4113 RepID=M1DEN7_SOLTU
MVNVDISFNYGGEWIKEPIVLYKKKSYNLWRGYDSDLLYYIDIVNEYTTRFGFVEECELFVYVPNIVQYDDSLFSLVTEIGTDCSETESEAVNDSSDYDSEELEAFATEKEKRNI